MKTTKTPYAYVYRAVDEAENIDGYLAKVIRPKHRLHKIFNFKRFGGDEVACLNATREAIATFAALHPRLSRKEVASLPRNKKDLNLPVGVIRATKKVKGRFYDFYIATWSPTPNHSKKKSFAVNYWGEDEARDLAIEARIKGLEEIDKE